MNDYISYFKMSFPVFFLIVGFSQEGMTWLRMVGAFENTVELPQINLNQTAEIKAVLLGIPPEYVNRTTFLSNTSRTVSQFVYPNNMTWILNVSVLFYDFPLDVMDSLGNSSFQWDGITCYNVTLLDSLLSQFGELAVPEQGYRMVFIWVPDDTIDHSWFYVPERPDLFLGRIDYFNGVPLKVWEFPSYFGGLSRTLYFDVSEMMEGGPMESFVTDTMVELFNDGLADIFPDFLGAEDSRMIKADMQMYENYRVEILWFNGTGEQFFPERIIESFQDLMPWTDWKVTMETRIMDTELNDLILSRTQELSQPLNYSSILSNGTSLSILARQNVIVDFYANSGEYDPLIRFFFDHVEDYFDLTDLEDKSIIPVVFLQLNNDTTFGGAPQAGVSWFLKNVIVVGFQGSWASETGESGSRFLTHILKHEIGHWLSLSHHSSYYEIGEAKIICPMSCFTNNFCTFCKDSRARLSFISYYNATIEALLCNQVGNGVLEDLGNALQLFYDWHYVSAIEAIISIYHKALRSVYEFQVNAGDEIFVILAETNSSISSFAFSKDNKTVSFKVDRLSGSAGFCNFTIPIKLLGGPYTVTVDKEIVVEEYDAPINGTHAFIYFTFNHSTHLAEIKGTTVIPEFPDPIILFLFVVIVVIVLTAMIRKKGSCG